MNKLRHPVHTGVPTNRSSFVGWTIGIHSVPNNLFITGCACALTFAFALFSPALIQSCAAQVQAPSPRVYRLAIHDTIQPITAGRLQRALDQANANHAEALLIDLDTPGGLLDSTRQMAGAILSSRVPVIVYIEPAGARAGSAGFYLLEAADIASMAPGTNAGAAHPVLASGTPDDTMKQKMENDAAAFLRSYIGRHGRNAQVAEDAVRNSKSYSADEALEQHLIDVIASSDAQLMSSVDGKSISRIDDAGRKYNQILHTRNAQIVDIQPTIRDQVLSFLANPNLALLLLVGGALLIYLEFNVPGTVVPGALGTVMVLLAIFALDLLPIRHTAVLLLIAAAVLISLEIKFASHGVLAFAGIACMAFGTLTLIDAPIPELSIRPAIAIGLCAAFGFITVMLLRLAMRARRIKALMGPAALVGCAATSMEPLWPVYHGEINGRQIKTHRDHSAGSTDPDVPGTPDDPNSHPIGHILVQGEIWRATSTQALPTQTAVRVIGFQGDILEVQPMIPDQS